MNMKKPHLLFFNPDQWRGDVMGHLGNPGAKTPVLDKLIQEDAVSFSQTYCQNPVCTPSRCSFMSGWYPHTRGHRTMHHMLHDEAGEETLLKTLKEAGYFVWWAGKNDLIPGGSDFGKHCDVRFKASPEDYERWGVSPRKSIHEEILDVRGDPEGDNFYSFQIGRLEKGDEPFYANDDWANVMGTIDFIKSYEGEQPLCLFLPITYPHPPYAVEDPWFSDIDPLEIPERTPEATDLKNRPCLMGGILDKQNLRGWTEERWRELRQTYYGMCSRVDHQFGLVLDALKEKDFYDDTAAFFFSDHGDFTGDFGIVEKAQNMFYDCLTHVPMVIKPPKDRSCEPGIKETLVELLDFYSTALDYAGVDSPHHNFSQSLTPIVSGESPQGRDAVFCQGGRLKGEVEASERESTSSLTPDGLYWPRVGLQQLDDPPYHSKGTMIRTKDFKYVQRLYEKDELYDLLNDPMEKKNLIHDLSYSEVLLMLKDRLLQWYQETGDVVPLKTDSR